MEDWKNGSKSRSVSITHDDGYGASCWEVELRDGPATVCGFESTTGLVVNDGYLPVNIITGEWPGLDAVICATLDAIDKP